MVHHIPYYTMDTCTVTYRDAYTGNRPHRGYDMMVNWAKTKPRWGAFSFTSNIDGHWEAAGFPADRINECHGSIRYWQCLDRNTSKHTKCQREVWPRSEWKMEVDPATDCGLELPTCPTCGALARPNVLMFGDMGWLPVRYLSYSPPACTGSHDIILFMPNSGDVQERAYDRWVDDVKHAKAKVVIIEIGAGTAIPTVRQYVDVVMCHVSPCALIMCICVYHMRI